MTKHVAKHILQTILRHRDATKHARATIETAIVIYPELQAATTEATTTQAMQLKCTLSVDSVLMDMLVIIDCNGEAPNLVSSTLELESKVEEFEPERFILKSQYQRTRVLFSGLGLRSCERLPFRSQAL